MIKVLKTCVAACLMVLPLGGQAQAKPPLREVAAIDDALYHVAVANLVRKRCEAIDARMLKAVGLLRDLNAQARDLGYSQAEIDAYTDSDVEKDRLKARAAAMFAERGINPDNPDDLCRYGREEIAANSPVGALLKAR